MAETGGRGAQVAPATPPGAAPAGPGGRFGAALVVLTQAVLVVIGCVFVAIGVVDVGASDALASKLFAGVLLVIGCGLLAAAAGFRRRRSWTGVVGASSLAAAFALATYLSLNAWGEETLWSVAFGAIGAACAVSIAALVRRCPPSFSVKSASILSVAGFVLGFFQFSYAESARVRVGSTLTLSTDLAPVAGGSGAIAATVRTTNPTTAKIQSLGSLYVVEGVRLCGRPPRAREHADFRATFGDQTGTGSFSPRVFEGDVETIQVGKVFEDRTYLEPGEEIVRRFAVAVPESGYDVVRLRVVMAVANGERLHLAEVVRGPAPLRPRRDGTKGVVIEYRVSEGSLVDRILHDDRVVEVVWESGRGELQPQLWASARLASGEGAGADRSTSYGMAFTRSTTELPLPAAEIGSEARTGGLQKRLPMFALVPPGSSGPDASALAGVKPGEPKPGKGKPHRPKRGRGNPHRWESDEAGPPEDDAVEADPDAGTGGGGGAAAGKPGSTPPQLKPDGTTPPEKPNINTAAPPLVPSYAAAGEPAQGAATPPLALPGNTVRSPLRSSTNATIVPARPGGSCR